MKILLVSSFVLLSCFLLVNAAPIFDDDDFNFSIPDITVDCKNLGCTAEASSCSKRTTTSDDRKHVNEEIKCYGANGNALSNHRTSKPNPSPGTIHSGYEFYGSYTGGDITTSIGSDSVSQNTNNDNVETFNK